MKVFGREPNDSAEKSLFEYLQSCSINGTAWFNLDIPGTNEIDCVSWFENIGMFVIEIKGFKLSDFKSIDLDNIVFANKNHQSKYGHKPPAWKQARVAARILSTFLSNTYYSKNIFDKQKYKSKNSCIPFIDSAVYFPFISESEFKISFPNVSNILSDSIIFNDCHVNDEYLNIKLNQIKSNRENNQEYKGKKDNNLASEELVKLYQEKVFISDPETLIEDKYDFNLIRLLESNDLNDEINTINFDFPIYRYGYAGTGKTIIALKILQKFAISNNNVLFTCYNKVLATDLKRFNKLSYSQAHQYFENITIKDIHELIYEYSPFKDFINFKITEKDSAVFFNRIVDGIINSNFFKGVYEYIVIDEAQDLKDYGWKLILYLAKRGENSLIVLNGKEQNLYLDSPSMYLKQFEDNVKRIQKDNGLSGNLKQKRRIYRNRTRTFLFAQAFLDLYPETQTSIDFITKNEARRDPSFEYSRDLGNFPNFIVKKSIDKTDNTIYNTLKKAILHCITENKSFGLGESGILIIVPWKYSIKYPNLSYYRNLAVKALNELNVNYIDYTIDENRRLDYLINQVRIVSFHSCRGIEANFSIILGLEEIFNLSTKANCDYHKLGYIILSRAKYETYVFIDKSKNNTDANQLIDYVDNVFNKVEPNKKFLFSI